MTTQYLPDGHLQARASGCVVCLPGGLLLRSFLQQGGIERHSELRQTQDHHVLIGERNGTGRDLAHGCAHHLRRDEP
jgi:hypothetical protein